MPSGFFWIIIFVAIIAAIYWGRAIVAYRQVGADADADFEFRSQSGMIKDPKNRAAYVAAYRRFHAPRGPAYVAAAMSAVLVLTYPAFIMIEFLLEQFWIFTGRGDVFHPGYLVWQFLIFFSILGLWVGIIYVTAREFHRRAPISFEQELEREALKNKG